MVTIVCLLILQMGKWGTERFSDLPKFTKLLNGRVRIWTQVFGPQSLFSLTGTFYLISHQILLISSSKYFSNSFSSLHVNDHYTNPAHHHPLLSWANSFLTRLRIISLILQCGQGDYPGVQILIPSHLCLCI